MTFTERYAYAHTYTLEVYTYNYALYKFTFHVCYIMSHIQQLFSVCK